MPFPHDAERPMTRAEWSTLARLALAAANDARRAIPTADSPQAAELELLCRKCLTRAEALFTGRVLP